MDVETLRFRIFRISQEMNLKSHSLSLSMNMQVARTMVTLPFDTAVPEEDAIFVRLISSETSMISLPVSIRSNMIRIAERVSHFLCIKMVKSDTCSPRRI